VHPHLRREGGFSLIELVVVLGVVALLIAIAIPVYMGFQARSHDTVTRQHLVTAAKVEASFGADGEFSTDTGQLALLEPALDWTGIDPASIHVDVAEVVAGSGRNEQVLMYARSNSGTWHGIRLVAVGGLAGRHTCLGPDVTDVNDITSCVGTEW